MIKTLSLCPVCYKKIPAEITFQNDMVVMTKTCDVHGEHASVIEKDIQHFANFYKFGTMGNNNTIIIHVHDQCNMKCSWCYYPMGCEKMKPYSFYHTLLTYPYQGYKFLLSGGEPTLRPDYFEFVEEAKNNGKYPSSITNMINLGNPEFFARTMNDNFVRDGYYHFAMSMQHPKNYSAEILKMKLAALENIETEKLKAMCVMFSIQSLDELEYIREFYNHTKHTYIMIRIRTMFRNWNNKGDENHIYLSDLHKAFLDKFHDLAPIQSSVVEQSNIYCLYLQMDNGMHVSLSCAPTVENVDYHLVSRPVYMLAMDNKCYPVPLAQIVNEGIEKGWHSGFKLEKGGGLCG